ncbi:MAG: universal stress protein [Deltaproteobacteria bacterium]|nr:universal stress protein [Deltaproteobacteria bacterium]MBW2130354.1 universal stress protein [Deltaproteobacteria bacterium]
MRILVAVDQEPYSRYAVNEVARFAESTWANVTILGVEPRKRGKSPGSVDSLKDMKMTHPLAMALSRYQEEFLSHFKEDECPYIQRDFGYELVEVKRRVWEELYVAKSARKELKARIRIGNPAKEILADAVEEDCDLIVIGCDNTKGCEWGSGSGIPQKVANDAHCSVLIAKEEKRVEKIVCCLDHDRVSQESLEMINQLVTQHSAKLEIIGLIENRELPSEVEKKMASVLKYYTDRHVQPLVETVHLSSLDAFIAQEARWGLMALWMGKKSILKRVFPRKNVTRLIKGSESSVLILR